MRDQRRIGDLKRMLQAIIVVCLASAAITLAIGFSLPAESAGAIDSGSDFHAARIKRTAR